MNTRITHLRSTLHRLNREYYVDGRSSATDAEYDQLMAELKTLEAANPADFDPNSPTQRVGSDVTNNFAKVRHKVPMLSLGNNFTAGEIVASFPATDLLVEWKIDGLSLSLIYVNGRLDRAVTRGDGTVGDDVTANARTIRNIPLELPEEVNVEVRGEVYMKRSVFAALNESRVADGDEPFANPRNAASGTLKQKDSAEVARRQLSFVAYQGFGDAVRYPHQGGMLVKLRGLGFETTADLVGSVTLLPALETVARRTEVVEAELVRRAPLRETLDFDVDGLVFKVHRTATQEELGLGTKSPKWATAFKFPPERKATILESITVQVGRTGVLTPVAELKPVALGGVVVKRASLMNADEVARVDVVPGELVMVERSAEVIPRCCSYPEGRVYTCPTCGFKGTLLEQQQHHALS